MDIKYIDPFIKATVNVFDEFFNVLPEVQKPYLLDKDEEHEWDVSAIIGIAGEAKGAVVISFPAELASILTSRLTGKTVREIDEDVVDTIGEVVNIVAGNAKKGLEEYRLMISLPSIVRGKNHKIAWPGKNAPVIAIPFKSVLGEFNLSVILENIIA
ncbi:MAG: chemotaxis protein CheX [Spirochaetales bacterium]|nr:chemotaxis protein CheX [Spirochaetales bacterium]